MWLANQHQTYGNIGDKTGEKDINNRTHSFFSMNAIIANVISWVHWSFFFYFYEFEEVDLKQYKIVHLYHQSKHLRIQQMKLNL
jgi:hypothetical protein